MKKYYLPLIAGIVCLFIFSCKKIDSVKNPDPTPPSTNNVNPQTANPVCDYDLKDTSLTNHGWTKAFEDDFTGNLNNWYAYTGGVTGEAQYYQPENAQIVNGVLQLSAKIQNVTGPSPENASVQKT